MAILKKTINSKSCWGWGKKGTLVQCWCKFKLVQPLWKTVWRFLIKTKGKPARWSSNSTPAHIAEENGNRDSKRCMHPSIHISPVYYSQGIEATCVHQQMTAFFYFSCPTAYEVLGLGIRSELKLQPLSCSNTRFLNHYARPGIELVSQCSRDVADPTAPQQDL